MSGDWLIYHSRAVLVSIQGTRAKETWVSTTRPGEERVLCWGAVCSVFFVATETWANRIVGSTKGSGYMWVSVCGVVCLKKSSYNQHLDVCVSATNSVSHYKLYLTVSVSSSMNSYIMCGTGIASDWLTQKRSVRRKEREGWERGEGIRTMWSLWAVNVCQSLDDSFESYIHVFLNPHWLNYSSK